MSEIQEAFTRMSEAMDRVQESFRRMALKLELLRGRSKKLGRRMERDYARAARRPALIHKGGKP